MKKVLLSIAFISLPLSTFAAGAVLSGTEDFIKRISSLIALLLPIVVALALLYFFWGLAQFVLVSGDDKSIAQGKNKMIWGVITLFVMISVWGLVGLLQSELGIRANQSAPTIPTLPGFGSSASTGTNGSGASGNPSGSGDTPICPPCSNFPDPACPGLEVC